MSKSEKQQPASLDNLRPVLKRLLDLRADKRDIEAEIKELDAQVRPVIANRGKMQLDNYIFECKEQPGRKTLDKKALAEFLEANGKSIEDFEKVGNPFTTLRIEEAAEVL